MPDWISDWFAGEEAPPSSEPPPWLMEIADRQAAPAPPSTALLFSGALVATVVVGLIARRRP